MQVLNKQKMHSDDFSTLNTNFLKDINFNFIFLSQILTRRSKLFFFIKTNKKHKTKLLKLSLFLNIILRLNTVRTYS